MRVAIVIFSLFLVAELRAERYLTLEQAGKLAFPTADRFEEKILRFSAEQRAAIQKKAGVSVKVDGNKIRYAYEGAHLLGVLFLDHVLGKHEIIDYAVALSPDGKILAVEILEYRESYGFEIRGAKWRSQFAGKRVNDPLRLNKDIYNISGATMSCRHVTEGIRRVLATFDLLCRPQLVAAGLPNTAGN